MISNLRQKRQIDMSELFPLFVCGVSPAFKKLEACNILQIPALPERFSLKALSFVPVARQ